MANEKRLVYLDDILTDLHEVVEAAKADPDEIMRMAEACTGTIIKHLEKFPTVDAVEAHEYDAIVNKLECLLCHATGGQYSKAGYSLEDMERMVTDYIEECCEEAVEEAVVRCKDCQYRGNDTHCPMCFEEQIEWDDDGYTEVDWITRDHTHDNGYCDRGERRERENERDSVPGQICG